MSAYGQNLADADTSSPVEPRSRASRRRSRPHHDGNSGSRLLIGRFEAGQIGEDAESRENADLDAVFERARLVAALLAVPNEPGRRLTAGNSFDELEPGDDG